MATYLYGLVLARNAHVLPPHIAAIGGAPLRVVTCEALDAIVASVGQAPSRADIDAVRAHDHALQSVVHHGATVAASRFGQVFPSDDDLCRHVVQTGERITRVLEEFDGCVEMRLLTPITTPIESSKVLAARDLADKPGTQYLTALAHSRARDVTTERGVRRALGPVVRAERVEVLPHSRGVAYAHLINRADEGGYRRAVSNTPFVAEAMVVGPLPLYTFADADV